MIKFDFKTFSNNFIETEVNRKTKELTDVNQLFTNSEMLGWYQLDRLFDDNLMMRIKETASFVRNNCEVFLVLGIGGSYLGASAVIEALNPYFYNDKNTPKIYFVGTSLSSDYYYDLIDLIKNKEVIINVISKSGETLETAIFYDLLIDQMKQKYNEDELQKRILVTTGNNQGRLWKEADLKGYKTFIIPDNIGGRYSVFSPVGLLPIAVCNFDINQLYQGAKKAQSDLSNQVKYAIVRNVLYKNNKLVEIFVSYEPKLAALIEWLKQLYAESLGKAGQGIVPISAINTRDLHSLGQLIQEGNKIFFETVLKVTNSKNEIYIPKYERNLGEINNLASVATAKAHLAGGVFNNIIEIDDLNEFNLGYLMQFFMISCVISGHLENVNPFNQNGVESYKNVLRELLNVND